VQSWLLVGQSQYTHVSSVSVMWHPPCRSQRTTLGRGVGLSVFRSRTSRPIRVTRASARKSPARTHHMIGRR
jgi:hypothetical protein